MSLPSDWEPPSGTKARRDHLKDAGEPRVYADFLGAGLVEVEGGINMVRGGGYETSSAERRGYTGPALPLPVNAHHHSVITLIRFEGDLLAGLHLFAFHFANFVLENRRCWCSGINTARLKTPWGAECYSFRKANKPSPSTQAKKNHSLPTLMEMIKCPSLRRNMWELRATIRV